MEYYWSFGLSGRFGICIHDFVKGRKDCVPVNGATYYDSNDSADVQLLFLIHMSDTDSSTIESSVSSFTDDKQLLTAIRYGSYICTAAKFLF